MKKQYITPAISEEQTLAELPLAASGVTSGNGIGYGGVDEQGELDPDVKDNHFDFDWD